MDASQAIDLARQAALLTLWLAAPILLTVMIVALVVSVLQAVTQIQEMTLSFVPKILAALVSVLIFGPRILDALVEFGRRMFMMTQ